MVVIVVVFFFSLHYLEQNSYHMVFEPSLDFTIIMLAKEFFECSILKDFDWFHSIFVHFLNTMFKNSCVHV
jgi:hypothetical protein